MAKVRIVNWLKQLLLEQIDLDLSSKNFFDTATRLIDRGVSTKKVPRKQRKRENKPWIAKGIMKSIDQRNKLLKLFFESK